MKVRILRILTRLAAGGPPIHSVLLTRELPKLGYETHLAVGTCAADEREMTYLLNEGDTIVHVPALGPRVSPVRDLWALIQLVILMRRIRPDIVHTHTAKAGALGRIAARLTGVPVVVHTFHGHVLDGYFPGWISRLVRAAESVLARWTDRICVLSLSQAVEIAGALNVPRDEKFSVVPLGFDLSGYAQLPEAPEPFTVAWLGRFVPIKGLELLARVIDQTLRQRPDIRFLIAGDGPEAWKLQQVAARYAGNVELLPWHEDVRPILSRCHLMTLTSQQEGTPVAIVQGMAAGRPFVATAVGGLPELAGNRERGVCCDADARIFAEQIVYLARNTEARREMGGRAAAYAQQTFAQQRLLTDLDNLYRTLMAGRATALTAEPAPAGKNF